MSWNILRQKQPLLGVIIAGGLTVLGSTAPVWGQNESDKVTASDGAANDEFGDAAAIDGDNAIVGARRHDHNGADSGSAYIYEKDSVVPGLWNEVIELLADDGFAGDRFGKSVAISGDVAVVGADRDDHSGLTDAGSVYIFRFSGGSWSQEAKLIASDADDNDDFGRSVAIDGNLVVVGAPKNDDACPLDPNCQSGAAYVFRYSGGSWSEEEILLASDAAQWDAFGISVAVAAAASDDVIIVGADGDDDDGLSASGSAYVYRYDGTDWNEETKLHAFFPWIGAFFGFSAAISDDRVVVGAYLGVGNQGHSGAAYVFKYDGTDWIEEEKLAASEPGGLAFGWSVSISVKTIVVGSPNITDNAGAAWVYHYDGTNWVEEAMLTASDAASGDSLGRGVGLSGGIAFVGARQDDDNGTDSGSAYVFDPVCPCPWDLAGDGAVAIDDLLDLLNAWGTDPGGPPDFDDNGDVDVDDLDDLVDNWGLCPCVSGTEPPSLADELAAHCLTMDDWDDFRDTMENGTQAEMDNYLCWMLHYLEDCTRCFCTGESGCPDDDPFNG